MPAAESPVPEAPEFAYATGDVIAGKYALEDLLGAGGMGAVFRARNITIDMPVAIKLIRTDLDRELLTGRLLQEARAAAKLTHPAIVRVFDVGKTALGDPFIVMELLHGKTLSNEIDAEGRISAVRAVQLLLPIADALSVAHSKGFVHRDVKPDNVFIANDDEGQLQPKLVDFGIVKHEQPNAGSQLTQVGSVLGSPDYMSPEQARGLERIDLRSDVWSFCVVLYECITGSTPFASKNYNALLRMIVEDEPQTLQDLQAADAELSAIVARGLMKDPTQRFPNMGLLGKALANWLIAQGITEDACGVSLEARWVTRNSDPAPRISRTSFNPDSWPEPPSGVRSVSRNFGNAPTLEANASQLPPARATTDGTARLPRKTYVIGGVALAIAGLALGIFLATSPGKGHKPVSDTPDTAAEPVERAPAAAQPQTPAAAQPQTPAAAQPQAPAAAPTPVTPVDALPPEASPSRASAAASSSKAARVAKSAAPSAAPAAKPAASSTAPAKPASDLLSPY